MPATVNGFGTSICGGRGDIGWGSYDGMEWFVAAFMPLIPYKAVHTFDWQGEQYRAIPIRWSWELTVRTFLHRWKWGLGLLGLILGFIACVDHKGFHVPMFAAGLALVALGVVVGVALRVADRRNRDIRLVIGPLFVGNCDPVHLPAQALEEMIKPAKLAYGTETFAEAVEGLLKEGRYAQAMWAARVAAAKESAREGEALTDLVLADPGVSEALEVVRRDGRQWGERMLSDSERQAPPADEPADALPADDDGRGPGREDDRARGEQDYDRPRRVRGEEDDDRRRRRRDEDY